MLGKDGLGWGSGLCSKGVRLEIHLHISLKQSFGTPRNETKMLPYLRSGKRIRNIFKRVLTRTVDRNIGSGCGRAWDPRWGKERVLNVGMLMSGHLAGCGARARVPHGRKAGAGERWCQGEGRARGAWGEKKRHFKKHKDNFIIISKTIMTINIIFMITITIMTVIILNITMKQQ